MRAVRRKGLFSYYEAYAAEIFGHRKRGVGRGARGVRLEPFFTAGSRPRPTVVFPSRYVARLCDLSWEKA